MIYFSQKCHSLYALQIEMEFPEGNLVFDYMLDDAGISLPALEEDEEEELRGRKVKLCL